MRCSLELLLLLHPFNGLFIAIFASIQCDVLTTVRQARVETRHRGADSLDGEMEEDERRRTAAEAATAPSSSWLGLRSRSAASVGQLSGATSHEEDEEELGEEEEEEKEDKKEETEESRSGGDEGRSTRVRGGRPRRADTGVGRTLRRREEAQARRLGVYWPGRRDHVRLYETDGERGGHALFERVGQTWYNDDPRYTLHHRTDDDDDDDVSRYHWRTASQQQQQQLARWGWQRTVRYGAVGPTAVYRRVPVNGSTNSDLRTDFCRVEIDTNKHE